MSARIAWVLGMCWVLFVGPLAAQKNPSPGTPQTPSPSSSGGGSATAQGITWPKSAWGSLTDLDQLKRNLGISGKVRSVVPGTAKNEPSDPEHPLYLLCYSLDITTGALSTPPFVLHQVANVAGMKGQCFNTAKSKKPLLARGFLGVAIDAQHVPISRMHSFNLTLTTATGQPINLYPVRPSVGSSSGGSNGGQTTPSGPGGAPPAKGETPGWGGIYYLIWPQELGGDAIPTVTVSVAYTPPVPGAPWQASTVYPEGSIVTPAGPISTCASHPGAPVFSGHYFVARTGGLSFNTTPAFCVNGILDGSVWWIDSGTTSPASAPAAANSPSQGASQSSIVDWAPGKAVTAGTTVFYPGTSHYYVATNQGTCGTNDPFATQKSISDGENLSWLIFGKNPPPVGPTDKIWAGETQYRDGQTVYDADSQTFFTAQVTAGFTFGVSGRENPFKKYPTTLVYTDSTPAGPAVIWRDVGSAAPLPSQPLKTPPSRTQHVLYTSGDVTFDPNSGHYFTAVSTGTSAMSPLVANTPGSVPETAPSDISDIREDFFYIADVQNVRANISASNTGYWEDKEDLNQDPLCANPWPYPQWNATDQRRVNDCITDPDTGMVFQLTGLSPSSPVLATNPTNLAKYQLAVPFFEQFSGTDAGVHEVPWTGGSDFSVCTQQADGSLKCPAMTKMFVGGATFIVPKPTGVKLGDTLSAFPAAETFSAVGTALIHRQPGLLGIRWEDIGTTVPSQMSGGEPADQTVAQAYTLTQVHPKYYFNISTGLVVSTIHSRTFGWATNAPSLYTPIQTASNPIVDPVLFLTVYWPKLPMDAESPWKWSNAVPAPTLGMSFVSPTSNLYFGLSSEIRRNIQIVFGGSTAQPQRLSSTSVSTTNTGTPPTAQIRTFGGFVGFSLNISGFIQTALGGK